MVYSNKYCCTTSPSENFQTLNSHVTPTFSPATQFQNVKCLKGNISTIRIMLSYLHARKGEPALGAERAQVHRQQITQNC